MGERLSRLCSGGRVISVFYEIDNGTNLRLIYEKNGKGIALKKIEILDKEDLKCRKP